MQEARGNKQGRERARSHGQEKGHGAKVREKGAKSNEQGGRGHAHGAEGLGDMGRWAWCLGASGLGDMGTWGHGSSGLDLVAWAWGLGLRTSQLRWRKQIEMKHVEANQLLRLGEIDLTVKAGNLSCYKHFPIFHFTHLRACQNFCSWDAITCSISPPKGGW